MAKELIFVADDFGMDDQINDAILHTHLSGQLTGTALMMAQAGTDTAVAIAREHPALQIGWHLHLCDSTPATTQRWPWDRSPARAGFSIGLTARGRELMRREVARQWELFQATGLKCRFINSHHHLHAHPLVYRAMLDVVGPRFPGWIRLGATLRVSFGGTVAPLVGAELDLPRKTAEIVSMAVDRYPLGRSSPPDCVGGARHRGDAARRLS